MNFTICQTITDGVSNYYTENSQANDYTARTQLSFAGITQILLGGEAKLYTIQYDSRATLSQRVRDCLPKGVYPTVVFKDDVRAGSIGFCRRESCRLFRALIDKREILGYMFTAAFNRAAVYLYENGGLIARIVRPRAAADDRTVYEVWVNDQKYLPKKDENDVTGKIVVRPDTYKLYDDARFYADAAALFAVYFDTVTLKPFGEFEYTVNKQSLGGIRRSSVRFNCENDYSDIVSPREEPLPPVFVEYSAPNEEAPQESAPMFVVPAVAESGAEPSPMALRCAASRQTAAERAAARAAKRQENDRLRAEKRLAKKQESDRLRAEKRLADELAKQQAAQRDEDRQQKADGE